MSERAKALVEAFYHRPLGEYRKIVIEVRERGGLEADEIAFVERRVDPVDAQTITRHATPAEGAQPIVN